MHREGILVGYYDAISGYSVLKLVTVESGGGTNGNYCVVFSDTDT